MKRALVYFATIITLLLTGCSTEIKINSPDNEEMGKLFLKIDKANAPDNVVVIDAFLTRAGFDTIHGSMNILNDTSAEIHMTNIASGQWYLKVDAKDSSDVVIYSGETDVSIYAGFVTSVSLVLQPTGEGTGSIYIYVTWGTGINPSGNWTNYPWNPIFTKVQSPQSPPYGLQYSKVILDNGIYKMWYNNLYGGASTSIGYATSSDGFNWQASSNQNPAVLPGQFGTWDSHSVQVGSIVKINDTNVMYYTGYSNTGYWHIGYATSPNGLNWTKANTPIIMGSFNEPQIHIDDVVVVSGQYYMYYTIRNLGSSIPYSIGLAVSADGFNWTRYSNNPILQKTESWEGEGVYSASVIYENNQWKMVYMNSSASGFGIAHSTDGINWTKMQGNPFFTVEMINNNWTNSIGYPFWRKYGNQYRLYFTGEINGIGSIGVITKE